MYYSRSLVQPDSIYRPEYTSNRPGVAGDPVPYTIAGDSLTTSILLACFILATIAIAKSGNFLQRQLKNFFRVQREGTTVITETSAELRFQFFLVAQTCLLAAIIVFFFSQSFVGESFAIAHYQIIALFTGEFAAYLIAKALLYTIVNWVFFDKKKRTMDEVCFGAHLGRRYSFLPRRFAARLLQSVYSRNGHLFVFCRHNMQNIGFLQKLHYLF